MSGAPRVSWVMTPRMCAKVGMRPVLAFMLAGLKDKWDRTIPNRAVRCRRSRASTIMGRCVLRSGRKTPTTRSSLSGRITKNGSGLRRGRRSMRHSDRMSRKRDARCRLPQSAAPSPGPTCGVRRNLQARGSGCRRALSTTHIAPTSPPCEQWIDPRRRRPSIPRPGVRFISGPSHHRPGNRSRMPPCSRRRGARLNLMGTIRRLMTGRSRPRTMRRPRHGHAAPPGRAGTVRIRSR